MSSNSGCLKIMEQYGSFSFTVDVMGYILSTWK